ncbi:hypothetical protein K8354_10925 [Polaribacter litorisediminis]|uniref:DUF6978 family protein n=1 Tax=Polaribacter litorisediminis TaxID=1908341 RepID=UPI001CBC86DC|nr:hypothetical protein [Polaribacter litorisediminis]UAM96840.1 hypothetical protein K8354_10925 [Polaribacter litorisediminis]
MLTNQEAKYLLGLEKVLTNPNHTIDLSKKKNRLELISHQDSDYEFRVEITTNQKIILKTSIHHLESNSFVGLLRIDFKGGHHNPANILPSLPDFLIPYADKWFDPTESHIHIYVEGYKPLAWAIPLTDSDFPIKDITHPSDLSDLIINFARRINLKSLINIQQAIL